MKTSLLVERNWEDWLIENNRKNFSKAVSSAPSNVIVNTRLQSNLNWFRCKHRAHAYILANIYIEWNGILFKSLCACAYACVRQSILENQNIMGNVEWGGTYEACRIPAAVWISVYVTQIYFKYHLMSRTDCLIIIIKVVSIQPASMLRLLRSISTGNSTICIHSVHISFQAKSAWAFQAKSRPCFNWMNACFAHRMDAPPHLCAYTF